MGGRLLCAAILAMVVATGEAHAQTVTRASLRADNSSPQQATTTINFYASAEGGNQPHEFKWWLWDGTAWRVLRDWNFASGLAWTPETPGQYIVAIWARSQGSSVNAAQALAQIRYDITPFVYGAVPKIQIFFTRNAAPHYVNTAVILEAWISGSYEPELKWVLWDGQQWTALREWQREELFVWTPPAAGVYRVAVWVRNGGVTVDAPQIARELPIEVLPTGAIPPASSINFSPDLPSPQAVGTPITLSAFSTGGQPPYEYKWWQWDGITWSVLADWNAFATLTWTPARAGRYTVMGWTRSQGTSLYAYQPSYEIDYTIDPAGTPPPARRASLSVQKPDPLLVGTPVQFEASASGGVAPYEFKWWVSNGSGWQVLRDWSESTTLTWTPASAGQWIVAIWARSHGVTKDASQALAQVYLTVLTGNESPPIPPPAAARITSNLTSPQRVGTTVTFSASAQSGVPPYDFKWWLSSSTEGWRVVQDWSASPTFLWTPLVQGSYVVAVWVRSNGETKNVGNVLAQVSYQIDSLIPPVSGATLTPDIPSPQQPNTPITFTAAATGGQPPAEFKWWLWNGTVWSVLRNWSPTPTLIWAPSMAGTYRVAIWARSNGVTTDARQALAQLDYRIDTGPPIPPVTGVTLASNIPSPQSTFTPITFTATPTGGVGPVQYKWWIGQPGGTWVLLRDWTTEPTYTLTPTAAGTYWIAVWARSAGSTEDGRHALAQVPFTAQQ